MNLLQNLDMEILRFIYNNLRNPVIDRVMIAFTLLGDLGVVWILISLFLLASKKYRKTGMMTICALILSTVLGSGILKYLIQRPRPFVFDPAVEILISKPLSYSFPSGHTASSFAAAGILFRELKRYRIYAVVLATLIAFSRMYLFVHYPTDIIGGITLGLICSEIVIYSFSQYSGNAGKGSM